MELKALRLQRVADLSSGFGDLLGDARITGAPGL